MGSLLLLSMSQLCRESVITVIRNECLGCLILEMFGEFLHLLLQLLLMCGESAFSIVMVLCGYCCLESLLFALPGKSSAFINIKEVCCCFCI